MTSNDHVTCMNINIQKPIDNMDVIAVIDL